jgi:hypothetical protein
LAETPRRHDLLEDTADRLVDSQTGGELEPIVPCARGSPWGTVVKRSPRAAVGRTASIAMTKIDGWR